MRLAPFYMGTAQTETAFFTFNFDMNFSQNDNLICKTGEQYFSSLHPK